MKNTYHFLFLILSLLIQPSSILAQQVAHDIYSPMELYSQGKSAFFIFLDNDKFIPQSLDEDRDYTNGLAFRLDAPRLNNSPFHRLNRGLLVGTWSLFNPGRRDSLRQDLENLSGGLELGSLAYTPRDIAAQAIIFDDRPYASVHFLKVITRIRDKKKNRIHSLGISYGVLATPIAEFVQRIVHTIGSIRPIPRGWDNQISHPWEPTLLLSYQRDRMWGDPGTSTGSTYADLRESISFDLGFRVLAAYALTGRAGLFLNTQHTGQLFLFGRIKPYILAYDATLQGQFRASVHTVDFDQIRHFRAEGAVGLGMKWDINQNVLFAGYGFYGQTPEARYPNHERFHFWGRFWLGWGF